MCLDAGLRQKEEFKKLLPNSAVFLRKNLFCQKGEIVLRE